MYAHVLMIIIGGSLGALSRFYIGVAIMACFGSKGHYATLLVNILGCLLIGILFVWVTADADVRIYWKELLITGFLGSFTTFSAFSLDVLHLVANNDVAIALGYIFCSVVLGIFAAYVGIRIGKLLF